MGLNISTKDERKQLGIGYFTFTKIRGLFVLGYFGKDYYEWYGDIVKRIDNVTEGEWEGFNKLIEDLSILINHSDIDGKLTVNECKRLYPYLVINYDYAKENLDYHDEERFKMNFVIMSDFKDLVKYAIDNDEELIFS